MLHLIQSKKAQIKFIVIIVIIIVALLLALVMSGKLPELSDESDVEIDTNTTSESGGLNVTRLSSEYQGRYEKLTLIIGGGDYIKSDFNPLNFFVYEDGNSYPRTIAAAKTGDVYDKVNVVVLLEEQAIKSRSQNITYLLSEMKYFLEHMQKEQNIRVIAFSNETRELVNTYDADDLDMALGYVDNYQRYTYDAMLESLAPVAFDEDSYNIMILVTSSGDNVLDTNQHSTEVTISDIDYAKTLVQDMLNVTNTSLHILPVDGSCQIESTFQDYANYVDCGWSNNGVERQANNFRFAMLRANMVELVYQKGVIDGLHNVTVEVHKDEMKGKDTWEINYG